MHPSKMSDRRQQERRVEALTMFSVDDSRATGLQQFFEIASDSTVLKVTVQGSKRLLRDSYPQEPSLGALPVWLEEYFQTELKLPGCGRSCRRYASRWR